MEIIIAQPHEIENQIVNQILSLIEQGSQIKSDIEILRGRLLRAELIAMIMQNGEVLTTATLKNPSLNYKRSVFLDAQIEYDEEKNYSKELGYICTLSTREGEKLCQKLLTEFIPRIHQYKIFATTRKASMKHILAKYGFKEIGKMYKEDLQLLTN